MPTPIQSSSITNKLRSFFRLRGRQIFTLDETTVPTVQVEDLTSAPYRQNHQVRWKMGRRQNTAIIPARNFIIAINLSRAPVMDLAAVPGVAVIERLTISYDVDAAPTTASDWIISLCNHTGFLASVEPGAVVTSIGSNVDAAFTIPVPALGVGGQVPVRLNMVQENVAPSLGALLILGRVTVLATDRSIIDVLAGEQVTIGENVCLLLRNAVPATTQRILVSVSGTYYPLARS